MLALGNYWRKLSKQISYVKNDVEIQETKVLNMFCKYTSYHPDLEPSYVEGWMDKNINIDLKKGMNILHIGSIYEEFLTMYSEVKNLNIEVIDHSLLRIQQLQKKLKSLGSHISAKQMDDTNLDYESYRFDCVISKIVFQFQSIEKQIQSLKEASRVLSADGNHHVLVNEQGFINSLYDIMQEFDSTIKINNSSKENLSNLFECLEDLYDDIEIVTYEAEHFIYDAKQFINLFLIWNDSNYINGIVKKHLGKQFHEFIELKIKNQGPIVLKQHCKLYKCSQKKKSLVFI